MSRCCVALRPPLGTPREEPPPYGPTRGCRRAEGAPGRSGDARGAERRTVSRLPPPRPGAPRSQPRDARRPLGYPARLLPAAVPSQRPHAAHHVDPRRTAVMSRSPAP